MSTGNGVVIRVQKTKDYTVMSNRHLMDRKLTLKAKGLLSLMLALPEDWSFSIAGLATQAKDGKAAVRAGLVELEENGYLKRASLRDGSGKIVSWEYTVFETPVSDFPQLENPDVGNRTELNTKKQNNPPIPPEGGSDGLPDPELFTRFWAEYPRKVAKLKSMQKFDKLCRSEETLEQMLTALRRQIAAAENRASRERGRDWKEFFPYPLTWLNQRRWEDEDDTPPSKNDFYREELETW